MRITWVTRSFLDYRIPVYAELDRLCGHQLTVIFYKDIVPGRCICKLENLIGERAIGLTGEVRLTGKKSAPLSSTKSKGIRLPFQPGLLRAIKKTAPEVMISDGFFQWTYAPLLLRFFRKIPHVMCYEPTIHTERHAQWYRTLYRKLASHAIDHICCNGVLCREYTEKILHIPAHKLSTGNMAADSTVLAEKCKAVSVEQRDVFRLQNHWNGTTFLYVGRLVELKGILPLLRAWKNASVKDATLVLVGEGSQESELKSYCREQRLDNVIFSGAVDYDDLPIYYRAADVFIIPTLQDNWSLVVPEAMACGLPIACSIYNGCHPELVHPENGWTFDPMDTDATANMLAEIICRKTELPQMGKNSLEIVAKHTPQMAAENIYQMCKQVFFQKEE